MRKQVKGLSDIHTILANERKVGGAIETEYVKLRSGERFEHAVIESIDMIGSQIISVGLCLEEGKSMIVHVNDISVISEPKHKNVCDVKNKYFRNRKIEEKLKYLKKLCEVNEGSLTPTFVEELLFIVADIGIEAAKQVPGLPISADDKKIIKIA